MKKIYLFILSVLACSLAATAQTPIVVNIDSPERVCVEVNYSEVTGLVAGDNTIYVPAYTSVYVKSRTGNILKSVVKKSTGSSEYIYNLAQCYLSVSTATEVTDANTWTVTSSTLDEARTAKCYVKVDKADKVQVMRSATYENVTNLVNGDWAEVKFVPGVESPLQIGPATYGEVINEVLKNGQPVTSTGSIYNVEVADGDRVEVKAEFEDIDLPVQFAYSSVEIKEMVTGVTVDGVAVTNFNDPDFTVKAGKTIAINFNIADFSLDQFTVNGVSAYVGNSYQQVIKGATKFEITAHRYSQFTATLNIDHAANVTVKRGYSYSSDYITDLKDGANTITVPETNTNIYIQAVSGAVVNKVTVNGEEQTTDYAGGYSVAVKDNMVINVETSAIERNATLNVYMGVDPSTLTYFSMTRADRSEVTLVKGWNEVKFSEESADDNPFSWSWYDSNQTTQWGLVTLNGVTLAPMYEGTVSYQATFKDGDRLVISPSSEEEPTAIVDVKVDNAKAKGVYTITGQKVNETNLPAGFYIVNGEKVVIR